MQRLNSIQDKCGIIAIFSPTYSLQLKTALLAAVGVQHRGQHGAGLCMRTKQGFKTHKGTGLIGEIFSSSVMSKLDKKSLWTLVHCRYGTFGDYAPINIQPCIVKTTTGESIAVMHNGQFVAASQMRKTIGGNIVKSASDTHLFARLLARKTGNSWENILLSTLNQVKGAYSLAIGIENSIYLARDKLGIRPLVLGKKGNFWIGASESIALEKIGAEVIREIKRGEVIRIDKNGPTTIRSGLDGMGYFCDFEWAYFSRPDSSKAVKNSTLNNPESWLSFDRFRYRCGQVLAKEKPIRNASFVVGVPDSGVSVASGYANALKLPLRPVIIRDHYDPNGIKRLFMQDQQLAIINTKVLGKLSLVSDSHIWKNAVVVVGDDSIVRANVSTKVTQAMYKLGAKEIHWVIGFPPVSYSCHLGVSIRSRRELIASRCRRNIGKITRVIGADSVNYISYKGFIRSRLLDVKYTKSSDPYNIFLTNDGCGGCITGRYPISKRGVLHKVISKSITNAYKKIAVLISNKGSGSNLQAIIDKCKSGKIKGSISVVVSDKTDAYGLIRAEKNKIPTIVRPYTKYKNQKARLNYGSKLAQELLDKFNIDLVVLAGWMIILPPSFLKYFTYKVINLHPGLIPDRKNEKLRLSDGSIAKSFEGKKTDDAIKAAIDAGITISGSSTHFVTNEVDWGPVIMRIEEGIRSNDTVDTYYSRLKRKEHMILPLSIKLFCEDKLEVKNDIVSILDRRFSKHRKS